MYQFIYRWTNIGAEMTLS